MSFIERVSYICLGKWVGMGMVLDKAELYNEYIGIGTGETTGTNYNEAIKAFNQVIQHLDNIAEQREKVLKMLKGEKSDFVWYNIVRTQPFVHLGMNGRYLPFIVNGKDDIFNSRKRSTYDAFNKSGHDAGIQVIKIKNAINKTLDSNLMVEKFSGKNRKRCYYFSGTIKVTNQTRMDDQSE
eukprot:8339082-Ditylum_brightwellii.AAC.1